MSNSIFHPSEVKMSHASMLKARRQHQKTRKLLDVAAKQAKRLAKQALAGPAVMKEKGKKEKEKKKKVKTGKRKKRKVQDGKSEKGQADQGGAWQARREEEQCGRREKRRVLASLDPEPVA